jgi:two-component system response regulator AtoC
MAPSSEPPVAATPIAASAAMARVVEIVRRAAASTSTVLVRGETGTGKEVVARALHAASPRASAPFVAVHCGAVPDALLESELFGHEKGAFTGADHRRPGRVESARGGTLFFDEIGDVTPSVQIKLLRLLQEKTYEPLGANASRPADVRFVAATHRDLEGMVKRGEFREDLFFRLAVVPIWIPPLRARRDDIGPLAAHLVAELARANDRPAPRLDDGAIDHLRRQRWPGNVRELENLLERLIVLGDGDTIGPDDVARELSAVEFVTETTLAPGRAAATGEVRPLGEEVRAAERAALARALAHTKNNRTLAARLLGVSRATLYAKLAEHGIE